ncbi:MAG: hypothetical protein A2017_11920 [Lentisphaerae bacterium GWF2_44_16]|nr:MAG: hypothetical protein A2017_11920 [Lentisphaerae bacterium GWF2_44_16]
MLSFSDAQGFLSKLEIFGIKLGLEQVKLLFDYAGNPHEDLKFIHVAGSNGKGSVCAMLSAALKAAGFRVGFYSSPHLISVRERFRVDGKAISEEAFVLLLEKVRPIIEKMQEAGRCPTYFEATTLIAALYFQEMKTDFVVWETGMGGRFDATNIITPECSVITGISLEHQAYLGDTVEKIAFEKAGIIKAGHPVFCGRMTERVAEVMVECGAILGCNVFFNDLMIKNLSISNERGHAYQSFDIDGRRVKLFMPGKAQRENASLAFAVLKYLAGEHGFDFDKALCGFADAVWPGRFQLLPDGSILDGAHNPEGIDALIGFLDEYYPGEKFSIVFGNFADKDTGDILRKLEGKAEEFIFLPVRGPSRRKFHSGLELQRLLSVCSRIPSFPLNSFKDAMEFNKCKRMLICGSLYLVGEVLPFYFRENEIFNI